MSCAVNRLSSSWPIAWRQVFLVLAIIAVAFKVAVPAGFMTAASAQADEPTFALVLCTAQGAVTIDASGQPFADHEQAPEPRHESPCAFAANAAPVALPNLIDATPVEFTAYVVPALRTARPAATPGRGLAAPPLPARGPPYLLI